MQTKKKILYVITKSNWGGAQKYVFDLATSLPKDQFEAIVAFGGSGALKEKLEKEHIRTIQLSSLQRDVSPLKDLAVFRELLSVCKKEKPDVIHLNSSKIGGLGSLAGRLSQITKIVFTAHGWAFNEKRNILTRLIIWKISLFTSMLSTDIITLSHKEQRQAYNFLIVPRTKIHMIRNGLRPTLLLDQEEARKKLGLPQDKKYVGTISELHKNKGLDILLQTAPHLEANFVIIGGGEEEAVLKNLAQTLGISRKIHFLGPVDRASSYLKAFDIFTLTSRKEGLPYALMEAGFAGLPAVASDTGGIPEIIVDQETGLLTQPENIEDVKNNIETLLQDEEFAQRLGSSAKQHITAHFSFNKTLQRTQEVYKK